MSTIHYRWYGEPEDAPRIGGYLLARKSPRGGYLVTAVRYKGSRGGLGRPVYEAIDLEVERVSIATARQGPTWEIRWDPRPRGRAA